MLMSFRAPEKSLSPFCAEDKNKSSSRNLHSCWQPTSDLAEAILKMHEFRCSFAEALEVYTLITKHDKTIIKT